MTWHFPPNRVTQNAASQSDSVRKIRDVTHYGHKNHQSPWSLKRAMVKPASFTRRIGPFENVSRIGPVGLGIASIDHSRRALRYDAATGICTHDAEREYPISPATRSESSEFCELPPNHFWNPKMACRSLCLLRVSGSFGASGPVPFRRKLWQALYVWDALAHTI